MKFIKSLLISSLLLASSSQAKIEFDSLDLKLELTQTSNDFKQDTREMYIMFFCAKVAQEYSKGSSIHDSCYQARESTLKAWENNPEIYDWL